MSEHRKSPWSEDEKRTLARVLLIERRDYAAAAQELGRTEAQCIEMAGRISQRRYTAAPQPQVVPVLPAATATIMPLRPAIFSVVCPQCGEPWKARQRGLRYCSNDCRAAASRSDHRYSL
jgi:hypothetical protein